MRILGPIAACLVALAVLVAAASAQPCPDRAADLVPAIDVTTWPDAPFRWRDIATNLYAATYLASYTYDSAQVTLSFRPCEGAAFSGHLSAANLKPNFAYQLKFVGKPTKLWGAQGDDVTNANIGFTGRWWRTAPNPGNSTDQDYQANHGDPAYIFEGYLVFGFFITDRFGNADVDLVVNSSYHVLFWESQGTKGSCDSPTQWRTVTGSASDPAYGRDVGPTDVGVYAQIERLCQGATVLPVGPYHCRFLLTEESFHQSGATEGYWAAAMVCDTVHFEIRTSAAVDGPPDGAGLTQWRMAPNPFRDAASLHFRLEAPGSIQLTIHDASGRVIRSLDPGVLPAGEHRVAWDGRSASGRPVPAGVYLFDAVVSGKRGPSGKVVLVR